MNADARRQRTVLIADDSVLLRCVLQAMLESAGYRVAQVANGLQAVEEARLSMPDAVLLDLDMPVMDGQEACRVLKSDPQTAHLRIVMISARIFEGMLDYAHPSAIADAYLSKPLRRSTLLNCLDALLGATCRHDLPA
ncbi:MAG: response regulator [Chloroflexi bacterium]|nr:response regulator [Chloroflexota bacterium]